MLTPLETERAIEVGVVAMAGRRDLIVARGSDAAAYLDGQLSQSVASLMAGQSAWSLLLQPQGKIDAWLRVTRRAEDEFWLDLDEGAGAHALERLERFKIRTDCTFTLTTTDRVAVRGPAAPEPPQPDGSPHLAVPFAWPGAAGFDLIGNGVGIPDGVPEGDPAGLEWDRVRLGVPAMGRELTEQTIPAEAGIVDRSVDFTKGCYVGQELVARVDSRGSNTPRRVYRLVIDGEAAPGPGSAVLVGGEPAGHLTSSVAGTNGQVVALASIKRGADLEADVQVESDDGPLPASISDVPAV